MNLKDKLQVLNIIKEAHRELGNDMDVKSINETIASINIVDVLNDKWDIDMFVVQEESGGVMSVNNKPEKQNVIVDCNHD